MATMADALRMHMKTEEAREKKRKLNQDLESTSTESDRVYILIKKDIEEYNEILDSLKLSSDMPYKSDIINKAKNLKKAHTTLRNIYKKINDYNEYKVREDNFEFKQFILKII